MKTTMFFLVLIGLCLTFNLSAQITKVKSTQKALTDNSLKTMIFNETSYFTFDYDKSTVTLKTVSESGISQIYTFKILKMFSEQTILGKTYNLMVSSTNFPAITRIYFSDLHGGAIWMDADDYTITHKGLTIME